MATTNNFQDTFDSEPEFERQVIHLLTTQFGWNNGVLRNPSEDDLIKNWAQILFENNREIDRLNDAPLTGSEMQRIIDKVNEAHSPLRLNQFILGKEISVKRDSPNDPLHLGKEVSLKIFNRQQIAKGYTRYQIAEQPKFPTTHSLASDRRGDFMLLINGMPLIHVELKKTGIPVSQATGQIEKYSKEGIFSQGLYSMVQVFVAMNPEDAKYFANPGPDGVFNPLYYFHWTDFYNNLVSKWWKIAEDLLSIPMAHQLIGYYTVADSNADKLMVMRSYQYHAVSVISRTVKSIDWASPNNRGGYIWHTTGSGKTLTSFKSAQIISLSGNADKVVFLLDRIELGTQSLGDYQAYADDNESVQDTKSSNDLLLKLESPDEKNILIVTSIQKMSSIEMTLKNKRLIDKINSKRLVIIVDECHRDTFGKMMCFIKETFPKALFFGFTGTPIHVGTKNTRNSTTTDVFGNELHKYTIANAIPDKNVLGFDPYMMPTYDDFDIRKAVALEKAKARTENEALNDEAKKEVYYHYMNDVPMAGTEDESGQCTRGIEDDIPVSQYNCDQHRQMVVDDIKRQWLTLSHNNKFHALLATSSIPEAFAYYNLLLKRMPSLKTAVLVDPTIDNDGGGVVKEELMLQQLDQYNTTFNCAFTMPTYDLYKKNVTSRLAHKGQFKHIKPEQVINIMIVVNQLLTGFDSKWLNTLYLDKLMSGANLVQAFSRTNRLFGPDKPFGVIRYYRYPHTMRRNVEKAISDYSGDRASDVFVSKLISNIEGMNRKFTDIKNIYDVDGIQNFEKLPKEIESRKLFAKSFNELNDFFESARVQGFMWKQMHYEVDGNSIDCLLNETTYLVLAQRYKELAKRSGGGAGPGEPPYDIDTHLTQIDTEDIDTDYMNSRFRNYIHELHTSGEETALIELHKTFASLSQEDQKYAELFLADVQQDKIIVSEEKTLRDYITEYRSKNQNDMIHRFADNLGLDEDLLREMVGLHLDDMNINEFGRLDRLKNTIKDKSKAKKYLETLEGDTIPDFRWESRIKMILRQFVINGTNLSASSIASNGDEQWGMAAEAGAGEEASKDLTLSEWMNKENTNTAEQLNINDVDDSTVFIVGCIRDVEHFKWIFRKKTYNVEEGLYNVRQGNRHGAVKRTEKATHAQYVILYHLENPSQYLVYRLDASHFVWDEEKMKAHQYAEPHGKYFVYQLSKQVSLPGLNILEILNKAHADKGMPLYITKQEL